MIYALNMTCARDADLTEMMQDTLIKYGQPHVKYIRSIQTGGRDYIGYGNGAAWGPSMMKLSAMDQLIKDTDPEDDDWILSVDSDVVFCNPDVFEVLDLKYGIIGVTHKPPYDTHYGKFGHCSGALIFIRGDIAKKMCAMTDDELNRVRFDHFKPYVITENEDVVLSYLAMMNGAEVMDLPGTLSSGNFEEELVTGDLKSYYHLNYNPVMFLGEECGAKWRIPAIIKSKGIEI